MFTPPPDTPGPNPIEAALKQYRAAMFAQNQDVGPAAEAKARDLLGRGFTYGRGGDGFNAWRTPLPTDAQLAASDASVAKSIASQPAPRSGPGGYNPVPDIMELRGGFPSQVSGYGVRRPSNLNIRDYKAKEAAAANDQTKANSFMVQAQAEQEKAEAASAEVALRTNPGYMKSIMDLELAKQGARPGSIGVHEAERESLARKGVGVAQNAPLPTADESVAALESRGVAPGSPEASAVAETNPDVLLGRLAGEPQHWYERTLGTPGVNVGDVLQLGIPLLGRHVLNPLLGAGHAPTPRQAAEDRARRMYPEGLPGPGVATPAAAPRPGVMSLGDMRAARRQKYDQVIRSGGSLLTGK